MKSDVRPIGRIPDMGVEYYAMPSFGSTAIRISAQESVAHYLASQNREQTPAMLLGSMVHMAVLEPLRLAGTYIVAHTSQCSSTTKTGERCQQQSVPGAQECGIHGGHETAARWLATLDPGVQMVPGAVMDGVHRIANGIVSGVNRYDARLLYGDHEVSYFAHATIGDDGRYALSLDDTDGSLPVCGRVDIEHPRLILDLKGSSRDGVMDARRWYWHAVRSGLHIQAALYVDLVRVCTGESADRVWGWIVHETTSPFAVKVYYADPSMIELGRRDAAIGMSRLIEWRKTGNEWAGWPCEPETVSREDA